MTSTLLLLILRGDPHVHPFSRVAANVVGGLIILGIGNYLLKKREQR